jgi:hypothetical protein
VEHRISGLEDKIDIKELLDKKFKSSKGIHKNSAKDQTCESWASKKKCKPKGYIIYSRK